MYVYFIRSDHGNDGKVRQVRDRSEQDALHDIPIGARRSPVRRVSDADTASDHHEHVDRPTYVDYNYSNTAT